MALRSSRLTAPLLLLGLALLGGTLTGCEKEQPVCNAGTCGGCCDASGQCQLGSTPQSCGVSGLACAACTPNQVCSSGVCFSGGGGGGTCTPKTCVELGANCGSVEDGCGGTLVCGSCEVTGESCGGSGVANLCGPGACTPKSCEELGKTCGSVSDGCGEILNCGTCTGPETCGGGGVPNECGSGCVAKTCDALGASCGTVSDGCGGMLQCGVCNSPETCGGGGTANVCGQGCVPETCESLGASCGVVSNGCGTNLTCGTCVAPQTCGGAGVANNCGAICPGGCPSGFTCDALGSCSEGDLQDLTLDVKVPQEFTVSGRVVRNGVRPTVEFCGSIRASIHFEHTTDERYSKWFYVEPCAAVTNVFYFDASLFPGTYKVSVERGTGTNLPPWTAVVSNSFQVQGALSNVVLDVLVPNEFTIEGTVTRNGVKPWVDFCGSNRASIHFEHSSEPHLSKWLYVEPCSAVTNLFRFNGTLFPGTYKVSVERGSATNLPPWTSVVSTNFQVQADLTNVVLDVPVPNEFTIEGTVTRNGAKPWVDFCGSNRASIHFEHTTDERYSKWLYVEPCSSVTELFSFSGTLYPGTYKVSVERGSATNLPPWKALVNPNFQVQANLTNVVLDVTELAQHNVSGRVVRNGVRPTVTSCGSIRASLHFEHASDSRYDKWLYVEPCSAVTNVFYFDGTLYPGTYKVSVEPGSGTNLPAWKAVVSTNFQVQAELTNVVLDVVVPPEYAVSGRVTRNGVTPTVDFCGPIRANLHFQHTTDSRFDKWLYVDPCSSVTNVFDFAGTLFPGTYKVVVTRGSNTNLPPWESVVSTNFTVQGDLTNVVLDVPVPPEYAVGGRVTLNGARPTVQSCGSIRANLFFEHTTDARYDKWLYVEPCSAVTNVFYYSGTLYPGVYRVSVERGSGTNLPTWRAQVIERLRVPSGFVAPPSLLVSQIYGGGGNSGATYTNDFVELFNAGTTTINLSGWSVQYASAASDTWQVTPLSGSVAPGKYFLVQQAQGTGGATPLPASEITGTINLSATGGKIALVSTDTPLAGTCPMELTVKSLVGYGGANCFEGSGPVSAPSSTQSVIRNSAGCSSTGNNASDFSLGTPAPRNGATAAHPCP